MREPKGTNSEAPIRWRRPLMAAGAGVTALIASRLLAAAPNLVESLFSRGLGPLLSRPLSLVTGLVPLSVAELLIGGYLVWVAVAAGLALRAVLHRERRLPHALGGGAARATRDAGVFVFLLYALWGFNYARPPIEERLGWPAWDGAETEEVVRLAESAVVATNRAYLEIHGTEDAGVPTELPDDLSALEQALDTGWVRTTMVLGLEPSVAARYGPVKRPLSSPLLARTSLAGVYSPYTGEANVIRGTPAIKAPHSMGHEQAHQRAVAQESEANFLSFVVGSVSPDPLVRYSAAAFAAGQLVGALRGADRRRLTAMLLPGVTRDFQDYDDYVRRNRTPASRVRTAVNDRYLRTNRVPGGVRNYGYSVRLLILHARENEGALLPQPPSVAGR